MSNRVLSLSALFLALVAFAVGISASLASSPGGGEGRAVPGPDPALAALDAMAGRIERMEAAVVSGDADLRDRVAKVEARLDALGGEVEERIAGIAQAGGSAEPDLASLDLKDLAVQARMAFARRDYGAAIECWRAVLARDPERDLQIEGLTQIAQSHRSVKEHVKEEQVWRELMALYEPDSKEGLSARWNVGWALRGQEKHAEALRMMEGYALNEEIPASSRRWARMWVGDSAMQCGDTGRARRIFEQLIAEYRDAEDANSQLLVRYAEERLSGL